MNTSPVKLTNRIKGLHEMVLSGRYTETQARQMMDLYTEVERTQVKEEQSEEWRKDNLEYDLRSTKWICDKAKSTDSYAQNLYAALCNNNFIRNEVWPILLSKTWSCSWRHAGAIIADMREDGDYLDWYCSGLMQSCDDDVFARMSKQEQEQYLYQKTHYVGESEVTDEIKQDLLTLGWIVDSSAD